MSQQLNNLLMELSRKLNSGHAQVVLSELLPLQKKHPKNPDVLHLMGLAYKKLGDYENAIKRLQASLKLAHNQPQVHNSLANTFKSSQQFELAEKHYKKAFKLLPSYVEAWKNYGLLLYEQEKFEHAIEILDRALQLKPQNASVLSILGDAYKGQENFEQAEKYYLQAISFNPNSITALHNLGLLYKLNDRVEEAIGYYEKALQVDPQNVEIMLSYANAFFEQADYQKAEELYLSLFDIQNDFVPGHELLNEFYWQTDRGDKFGSSYVKSLEKEPHNPDLIYSYANSQYAAHKPLEAKTILHKYSATTDDPKIAHLKGKIYADEREYTVARSCFEQALSTAFSAEISADLIKLNIINAAYDEADRILDDYLVKKPYDQLAWALRSLNWRLQGDERFEWLSNDYHFVKPYTLDTPDGYANLSEYLEELTQVLLHMHTLQKEPLRQTLISGSQTPGRLLHKQHPVIHLLKESFSVVVHDYISALPEDAKHPLLSRKSKHFTFSGSWSVKLKPGGFHVNHVHPEGWLSSSFYVSIPENIVPEDVGKQGSIKFGESPLRLGDREKTGKIITPRSGMLVLFPSYTWHGTIPFESESGEYRITAPFDVLPV